MFGCVAKPWLCNHREVQPFSAVPENAHVPDVFVLLGLRGGASRYRVLQFLTEPPDMPWQLYDVEIGDGHHTRTAEPAGEDRNCER